MKNKSLINKNIRDLFANIRELFSIMSLVFWDIVLNLSDNH